MPSVKTRHDILPLGDPRLYMKCEAVHQAELHLAREWKEDLHAVMEDIRRTYHFGRAIAAPQLGIMKRIIYLNIDRPVLMINPVLSNHSDEMIELWDDCMCFPMLLVRVRRHRRITVTYTDESWEEHQLHLEDDLAELIQHEVDHLEGILCTMRAIDNRSFRWRDLRI